MNTLTEVRKADREPEPSAPEMFALREVATPLWSIERARRSCDRLIGRCRERLPALAPISLALDRLSDRRCEVDDYQLLRNVAHTKVASWKIERLFLLTQLIIALEAAAVRKVSHKDTKAQRGGKR